jgi:hypothetical protein
MKNLGNPRFLNKIHQPIHAGLKLFIFRNKKFIKTTGKIYGKLGK